MHTEPSCIGTTLRRDGDAVVILDQTRLPFETLFLRLENLAAAAHAIRAMQVRGAPLIGATAAYGVALALADGAGDDTLEGALATLAATRPTAVNLAWALARMRNRLQPLPPPSRQEAAWQEADAIAAEDVACNRAIGEHGLALLRGRHAATGRPVRVMTHCNAGWLATVGWGTALAPIYLAHAAGVPVEVWVSETRPRNQGLLTAWELERAGVPHTLMADNAAGILLSRGEADCVLVGADRIAANGDVANKVGTYLKALAAHAHGVPFWVAAPMSTVDFACPSGEAIPIEARDAEELRQVRGHGGAARLAHAHTAVVNPAFDVTPATLVSAIITERGVFAPGRLPVHR